jgi:hypothetical protein
MWQMSDLRTALRQKHRGAGLLLNGVFQKVFQVEELQSWKEDVMQPFPNLFVDENSILTATA